MFAQVPGLVERVGFKSTTSGRNARGPITEISVLWHCSFASILALLEFMLAQAEPSPSQRLPQAPDSYRPHDPTQTLLYRVIQENFRTFVRDREAEGRYLPRYVTREFESFMGCGVLANGFMRLKCEGCRHEKLVAFSCYPQLETIRSGSCDSV